MSNTFDVFNWKIRCGCELVYTQTTRFIPNWNRIFPLVLAYLIIFVCLYLIIINDFCLSQTINLLFPGNFFRTASCYLNISFKYTSLVTLCNLNCQFTVILRDSSYEKYASQVFFLTRWKNICKWILLWCSICSQYEEKLTKRINERQYTENQLCTTFN